MYVAQQLFRIATQISKPFNLNLYSVCRISVMDMDVEYKVLNLYRSRQYDECIQLCDIVLKDRSDRMIEFVQMRAMTVQAKIAGNGYEEVEYYPQQDELAPTTVAKTPRPCTSFQREIKTAQHLQSTGRATATLKSRSGMNTTRARTALHTASRASRAATALAGETSFTVKAPITFRLLAKEEKSFAPAAKTLFEYVFYCEGNIRKAMEVIFQAQKLDSLDWWWFYSLARCFYALGMFRDTEDCLRKALARHKHISIYLRLTAMYVCLNQPLSALETCRQGLSVFHNYTPLLLEQSRIYEKMGNLAVAVKYYRMVALEDASNVEAIANIAMYNFYNDQPEIALRYYRRLLATNPANSEIYNNLGLCCLYCNQWDLIVSCFRQALYLATDPETRSDTWFNLAHVALSTGDMALARRCLQASLAITEHGPANRALKALDMRLKAKKKS